MSNQQHYGYPPPGPGGSGPSNYYQQPNPYAHPQYYPNPGAPAFHPHNPYQSPYNMGMHMGMPAPVDGMHNQPHVSPPMQHSPRLNGHGRGGYHTPRGGPSHGHAPVYAPPPPNYHPAMSMGGHPQAHYLPPPHNQPPPMSHPYPQPHKYPGALGPNSGGSYSPMHYPGTPDGSTGSPGYSPGGWTPSVPGPITGPQTLSPLPKQLGALAHFGNGSYSPVNFVPPQAHPLREGSAYENGPVEEARPEVQEHVPSVEETPAPSVPLEPPVDLTVQEEPAEPADEEDSPTKDTVSIESVPELSQEDSEPTSEDTSDEPATPTTSTYDLAPSSPPVFSAAGPMSFGIVPADLTLEVPSEPDASPALSTWAVWSKRPTNPSLAPGLLFSRRSRPPRDVLQQRIGDALDDTTPPASPRQVPLTISALSTIDPEAAESASAQREGEVHVHAGTDAGFTEASVDVLAPASEAPTEVGTVSARSSRTTTPISTPTIPPNTLPGTQPPLIKTDVPSTSASTSPAQAATVNGPTASSTEAAAVPTPAPPVKAPPKSWAALLHGSSESRSKLPTSAVVGFSIPAGIPTSGPSLQFTAVPAGLPTSAAQRAELLSLLTRDPAGFAGWAPRIRPRGLVNQGNMCFANAVLQSLVYCPPFHRLFTDLGRLLPKDQGPVVGKEKEKEVRRAPLVDATVQFVREFEVKDRKVEGRRGADEEDEDWEISSFLPTYFYEAMKEKKRFEGMRGGQQEDAEEFLGFYLDALEDELLSITNALAPPQPTQAAPQAAETGPQDAGWMEVGKRNRHAVTRTAMTTESPITRVFGGKFRSTLRVPHQKDSVMVEDWRSLQLDITPESVHTIKEALAQLSAPQTVQITSPIRAGQTVDAQQTVLIESLPSILVLHLKRFMYDKAVRDVVKLGKKVAFERELEINPDLMAPSSRKIGRPTKYKLFAVLYHHGLSASGGHYTLDVLHPNRDLSTKPREAWIRIDDELVSDVVPDDVFGGLERDDRCAYLLFYRKIGGSWK